jgi:hypothetical protein
MVQISLHSESAINPPNRTNSSGANSKILSLKNFKQVVFLGSGEYSQVNSFINKDTGVTIALKQTRIKELTKDEKKTIKKWA